MRPYLLNGPLHPLSFDLVAQHPHPKEKILNHWRAQLPGIRNQLPPTVLSSIPVVCSELLWKRLQEKTAELCSWLAPTFLPQAWDNDTAWSNAPQADVISLDLAIVHDESDPSGWNVRWVEFQAFTSVAATTYMVAQAAREVWPILDTLCHVDCDIFAKDWVKQYKQWVAPSPLSVLLEHNPMNRATSFDLETNSRLLKIPLIPPEALSLSVSGLSARLPHTDEVQPVEHIFNRLILEDTPHAKRLTQILNVAPVSWHCHPSWYYRVNKRLLASLPLENDLKCASAEKWRELGVPATQLVLKEKESYGGNAVRLHVSESDLDSLESPENWLVQPRFTPLPLFIASDDLPVFGEIRCIVQLTKDGGFKTFARFARIYRGDMASMKGASGAHGTGMAILYGPPVTPN